MYDEEPSLGKGILATAILGLLLISTSEVYWKLDMDPLACIPGLPNGLYLGPLDLIGPSIDPNSTPAKDLHQPSYMSMVGASYMSAIESLVPQTVLGFIQGSEM